MILKQYYLGCLANATYLLGAEARPTALVVGPQRDMQKSTDDTEPFGPRAGHV